MKMMTRAFALATGLACGGIAVARAQEPPAPAKPDAKADAKPELASELQQVIRDLNKAAVEFNTKRMARQAKPGDDPIPTFVPRLFDIATRAKGTDTGLDATSWVVRCAGRAGPANRKAVLDSFDALATTYLESPKLEQTVAFIPQTVGRDTVEPACKTLDTIANRSPHEPVKAAALFSEATLLDRMGRAEECVPLYKKVVAEHPTARSLEQAKRRVFVLENLQVGKPAPDFEAEDETGKKFKLSEYRGKVVVVDFWGFW